MLSKLKERRQKQIDRETDRTKKHLCNRTKSLGACNSECTVCPWGEEK